MGALAIFVKTPGLSPVKTRLAKDLGREASEEFYALSVSAVESVVCQVKCLTPFWSVAEEEGMSHDRWKKLKRISQGSGGFGERLHNVYSTLIDEFPFVILIGADSPQITAETLNESAAILSGPEAFVIGECFDGGFYLFGGNKRLPKQVWNNVSYSTSSTSAQLKSEIRKQGPIRELPVSFDVDTAADLKHFKNVQPSWTCEQKEVAAWAATMGENTCDT